jgi:putative transposase
MPIKLIQLLYSLLFKFHLWLQCLLITSHYYRKRTCAEVEQVSTAPSRHRNQKKPEWVIREVIRLKAFMPHSGCRVVANTFNRLHSDSKSISVSKSYVAGVIINNKHAIYLKRKEIKSKSAKNFPANTIWAMDLTTLTDEHKHQNIILGIMDCGTRANLLLKRIPTKKSSALIFQILEAMQKYGKPAKIRTDNEPVFTSFIFRTQLKLLRIKHQLTEVACPWMNGRIERFFGTLKKSIKHIVIKSAELDTRLMEFRFHYNHVRPHQNLSGKTPAEAWSKRLPNYTKQPHEISLWQGVLAGYYWDH